MDCDNARLLLAFVRPGLTDLEEDDAHALQAHLDHCPECQLRALAQRQTDDALGEAMRHVPVPEDLLARLTRRVEAEYLPLRRRRRLWTTALAAAASVLLAVVTWATLGRTSFDLESTLVMATPHLSAEEVEDWYYETHRVRTVAPPDFQYGCLTTHRLTTFQGRQVPLLNFVLPNGAHAEVLILSGKEFDLDALRDQPRTSHGGYTAEFRPHPENPNYLYLVRYTGAPLEAFLTRNQGPAV